MNDQEKHWSGPGGDAYQARNAASKVGSILSNIELFSRALVQTYTRYGSRSDIDSIIEFGAGVGNNVAALNSLLPDAAICSVEINPEAAAQIPYGASLVCSILDYPLDRQPYDLVLTKGLLIHIAPTDLPSAYARIHAASRKYVLLCEYYSPKPRMIPYHGQDDRLWARDFAGELLDAYPDMHLVDYGFVYHRDPHPQDDLTWMLMEKSQ